MGIEQERKKAISDFNYMRNIAEARAYQNLSMERPLTPEEFKKYNNAMDRLREAE